MTQTVPSADTGTIGFRIENGMLGNLHFRVKMLCANFLWADVKSPPSSLQIQVGPDGGFAYSGTVSGTDLQLSGKLDGNTVSGTFFESFHTAPTSVCTMSVAAPFTAAASGAAASRAGKKHHHKKHHHAGRSHHGAKHAGNTSQGKKSTGTSQSSTTAPNASTAPQSTTTSTAPQTSTSSTAPQSSTPQTQAANGTTATSDCTRPRRQHRARQVARRT